MLDYISLKVKRRLIKVHNMLRNFLKKKFLRGPRGNSGTGNCLSSLRTVLSGNGSVRKLSGYCGVVFVENVLPVRSFENRRTGC